MAWRNDKETEGQRHTRNLPEKIWGRFNLKNKSGDPSSCWRKPENPKNGGGEFSPPRKLRQTRAEVAMVLQHGLVGRRSAEGQGQRKITWQGIGGGRRKGGRTARGLDRLRKKNFGGGAASRGKETM